MNGCPAQMVAAAKIGGFMRRRICYVFVSLWWALVLSQSAAAQSDEWKSLVLETRTLYREGKLDRAVLAGTKALEIAERDLGPEHALVAASLIVLVRMYQEQGQYATAEPLCKRALAILEKVHGPNHPDLATTLENMSVLYVKTGKAEEAKKLANRAAEIRALKR